MQMHKEIKRRKFAFLKFDRIKDFIMTAKQIQLKREIEIPRTQAVTSKDKEFIIELHDIQIENSGIQLPFTSKKQQSRAISDRK